MITQIYTVRTPEEALAVAKAGADHLGTFPKSKMGADGVDGLEMCKKICDALRGVATSVMITLDDTPEECIRQAVYCKPDIVHVCGDEYFATPELCAELKKAVPGIRVMQAIPVGGPESVEMAKKYAEFCDLLILDTNSENVPGIGAAGETHDWNLDKAIVDAVDIPIIIAGGLDPENVADAIRLVKPWGVDSCTRTNLPKRPGQPEGKDIELCRQFCENAVAAAKELGL